LPLKPIAPQQKQRQRPGRDREPAEENV
jgi:two-component system sensor histidine kinase MtrB